MTEPSPAAPVEPSVFRAVLPVPAAEPAAGPVTDADPGPGRGGDAGPRASRWGFGVGLASLLAGVGLLGYVGWEMVGTNWVAHQAQEAVVADLEAEWKQAPGTVLAEVFEPGEGFALVRVPRFGRDFEVPLISGVGDGDLSHGLGHFPGSAPPGEVGNFAVAGHRVTHGEPLRDMPSLRPGDEVIVETRDKVFTYEIATDPNDLVVDFSQTWVVDPVPSNPDKGGLEPEVVPGTSLLTLVTCSELFNTDDRMVAFGHLVDTRYKG